jgi:hypothetical protein
MSNLVIIKDGDLVVDDAFMAMKKVEETVAKLKQEEDYLKIQRQNYEANLEEAKTFIKEYMKVNGLAEITGTVVKYSLSKSQPQLVIDDESVIPAEYKEETVVTKIRKDAIKDQLKMGDNIPGCYLRDTFALKVGVNK